VPSPKIVFAIEVGKAYGLGHMMRCRVLAGELMRRGCKIALAVRGDLSVLDRWPWPAGSIAIGLGATAESAAADVLALAQEDCPDWLVVDGYGLAGTVLLPELRRRGMRTLAFDDTADAPVPADLILNQNTLDGAPYGADARTLLGPRFALVDADYRHARRGVDEPARIRRILVSFGGSDRKGMTSRVLLVLARSLPDLDQIDVVSGPFHAESHAAVAADLPVRYHQAPSSLALLIAGADVVISAAGSGCWEVCCVGRPLIAVQTAENQRHVVAMLRHSGGAITLERLDEDMFMAAWERIRDFAVRRLLAASAQALVDGMGAARVADALGC
jgi:UDP-2,4-diacetamido-2,4,6-trideoxy-beta-L-altropyranose hydrolase